MIHHPVTDLPLGYDERTEFSLSPTNDIIIRHPVMGAMIYDEQVMRWSALAPPAPKPLHVPSDDTEGGAL